MKFIAVKPILWKNRQYQPGDQLPETIQAFVWVDCGSAKIVEDIENNEEIKTVKARRKSAPSGLSGTAVNSESEENLTGKIPETEKRKRK